MDLSRLLDRCEACEERAAAIYRAYAAGCRDRPQLCALWTSLARDEEEHVRAVARVRRGLKPHAGRETDMEGWDAALGEVERRLAAAERLGAGAGTDRQLAAALELEMSELDPLRRALVGEPDSGHEEHARRVADMAGQYSSDPHVSLLAALLLARTKLGAS